MRRLWPLGHLTFSLIFLGSVAPAQGERAIPSVPSPAVEAAASLEATESLAESPRVLSFKEWKGQKISAAISAIVGLRKKSAAEGRLEQSNPHSGIKVKAPGLSPEIRAQLSQAKINLDVVRDLSVTDYFTLYLSEHELGRGAFTEAVRKLDERELVELLSAYGKKIREIEGGESASSPALGLGQNSSSNR